MIQEIINILKEARNHIWRKDDMIKVGLIGYGYWGKIVYEKLKGISDIKFICRSKDTFEDKLDLVDWVFVITPDNTHYQITKICLEHGKNVFCEKPFTNNYNNAVELYRLAQKHNVRLYVDDVFNYRDEIDELHNIISKNENINVIWNTNQNQNYLNRLMWHDLYMLYPIFKQEININWPKINNVTFQYGISHEKFHEVAGIDFTNKPNTNDALFKMLNNLLNDKEKINFDYNKLITLRCQQILDEVKKYV